MGNRRRRRKPATDLISQLPADAKDLILKFLPIQDAARTALLSTSWKDVWYHHGQLLFGTDFFSFFRSNRCHRGGVGPINTINNVLMLRAGQVNKFEVQIHHWDDPIPEQSDLDRWCLFLSRKGIEELEISITLPGLQYTLPNCILSCPTIRQLVLRGFLLDCPVSPRIVFPAVKLLVFDGVEFRPNVRGTVSSIPNLEELVLCPCDGTNNFVFNALKLEGLGVDVFPCVTDEWGCYALHLAQVKTLYLSADPLWVKSDAITSPVFPIAINLEILKVRGFSFACKKDVCLALQFLQKCPKLMDLRIDGRSSEDVIVSLSEDPPDEDFIIVKDLVMLKTVKIRPFHGYKQEMHYVKSILLKSPVLEELVIMDSCNVNASVSLKIARELMSFPRASPKARLVFMDYQRCWDCWFS
ncbi:unnamed protein product [Cuscuta epithymum]|uniref:FBD domain-containing protein n=1 Tax=Cuscuta epithymum TaxID=186058 RepID=A0AAV0DT02_9ASTE|nr:unnamed protein product [Cuscuta epithymum]